VTLDRARAWWEALRGAPGTTRLSPANLAADLATVEASLRALPDAVDAVQRHGHPPETFGLAAAATVPTAPIEWVAVALAVGATVVLKRPRRDVGLLPAMVDAAARVGAPLHVTDALDEVGACEAAVLLGADASARAWANSAAGGRRLAFGHRVSVVAVHGSPTEDAAAAIASDVAAADTRGCMSPIAVFVDGAADRWAAALAEALETSQRERPRGHIDDAEAVALRTAIARARALGRASVGDGWSVLQLPADRIPDHALPRQAVVIPWPTHAGRPPVRAVGALATTGPTLDLNAPRVTELGRLQHPPLCRHHDGFDHLAWLGGHPDTPSRIAVLATDVDTQG
jgi:hypothetical protein